MILANHLLSPEYQMVLTDPDRWGWLTPTDPTRYDQEVQDTINGYPRGVATLPMDVLATHALPEPSSDWVTAMEQGWIENVLEQ